MLEVALLIGLQASGKTSFYQRMLASTHAHVSKDAFPNARNRQRRQLRMIADALATGQNVAVDNTNPSAAEWQPIMDVARTGRAAVVGYWFPPDLPGSLQRNALRQGKARIPEVGLYATRKRIQRPHLADGFDALHVVRFDGEGGFTVRPWTEEE